MPIRNTLVTFLATLYSNWCAFKQWIDNACAVDPIVLVSAPLSNNTLGVRFCIKLFKLHISIQYIPHIKSKTVRNTMHGTCKWFY